MRGNGQGAGCTDGYERRHEALPLLRGRGGCGGLRQRRQRRWRLHVGVLEKQEAQMLAGKLHMLQQPPHLEAGGHRISEVYGINL